MSCGDRGSSRPDVVGVCAPGWWNHWRSAWAMLKTLRLAACEVLVPVLPARAADQLEREQLGQLGLVFQRRRPSFGGRTQQRRGCFLHLAERPLDIVDPGAVGPLSAVESLAHRGVLGGYG